MSAGQLPMAGWWRVCLVFLALVTPAWADGTDDVKADPKSYWLTGWLTLSTDGRVLAFEHDAATHLPEVLHQPSEQVLRATRFEPAVVRGEPTDSRSWLEASIKLRPQDDGYAITMQSAHLGPRPHAPFFPRLGMPPTHPARMLVDFEVDETGRTKNIRVQALDRRLPSGLARRIEDYVRSRRYDPVQVGGSPVATRIRLPMALHKPSMPPAPFALPPVPRDPGLPGAQGQSGYAPERIFTAVIESSGTLRP